MIEEALPKNWIWTTLGEVCLKPQYGWTTSASNEGNIHLLRTTDITSGQIDWENVPFCKKAPEDVDKYLLKDGDIVISRAGSVGYSHLVKNPKCSVFASYLIRFIPLIHESFVSYFLKCPLYWNSISEKSLGIAVPNVNATKLREIHFSLPPLLEQRAIVSKIEQLFSELDNGIANLKLAQEQLKVYRQAVLKKAFEGKLTKKWREQQADLPSADELLVEIKRKREAAYNAELGKWKESTKKWEAEGKNGKKPTKPKKPQETKALNEAELSKLSKIPEKWKWVKTTEIIDQINNGYTPKANFLSSGTGEIPFIKVYNLNFDGSFNFEKDPTFIPEIIHRKELARAITYPGDILISIVGPPLGKVSIVTNQYPEWNINQAIVRFRPNKWITSKIISYYLQNPKIIHWLEGTSKATAGQYNVKVSTCREIPFPFPPIAEQQAIVTEIEMRLSVCDKLEQDIAENLKKAEALRQSILKKAFEGKLLNERELEEVRNAPDWEPAEVLLERVKAEKTRESKNGNLKNDSIMKGQK